MSTDEFHRAVVWAEMRRRQDRKNLLARKWNGHLTHAREVALEIAIEGNGTCDVDQVMERLAPLGVKPGPWCCGIFAGWKWTGRKFRSKRGHNRPIKVWRLVQKLK